MVGVQRTYNYASLNCHTCPLHSENTLGLRTSIYVASCSCNCNNSVPGMYVFVQEFDGPMKPPLPSYPLPTARVFPTLTPLVHPELVGERLCGHGPFMSQRMVMLWGKKREQQICNEVWMLDMESFIWVQVGDRRTTYVIIYVCHVCHWSHTSTRSKSIGLVTRKSRYGGSGNHS